MKIGVVLPHNEIGSDAGAMRAYAQGIEELGADHLLIYDHVLGADPDRPGGWKGPYNKDTQFHEPLTTLSFIAALTKKVELATTVLILPQRQTALVAKQAAELAMLSDNRFRMGVGTGWNKVEYEALDVPFAKRGRRQEEQVELLRKLWTEDSLDFSGKFHRVDKASIAPRPSQPVPIWFGGIAPVVLERCARLGDGWMPLGRPDQASADAIAALRTTREKLGLPWDTFGIQAQVQYAGGTVERWQKAAKNWADLGATHLAVITHGAGETDVDGHLQRLAEYLAAVNS